MYCSVVGKIPKLFRLTEVDRKKKEEEDDVPASLLWHAEILCWRPDGQMKVQSICVELPTLLYV